MAGLFGKHTVSLDPKGRLAIPTRHRNLFPEDQQDKIVITRGVDSCITGYYYDKWEEFKEKISTVNRSYIDKMTMKREFIGRSVVSTFDKLGRITLPADLIRHAQLTDCSEVYVMGCEDVIEIWNPELYEAKRDEAEKIVQTVMSEISID